MKNKYFYPIFKLKAKSWIRYWLLKKTEFKGKLSEILTGFSFNLENTLNRKFKIFEIQGNSIQDGEPSPENEVPIKSAGENGSITEKIVNENFLSFTENTISYAGVTTNIDETKMKFNGKMVSVTNIFNSIREDKVVPAGTYKLSYTKLSGATSGSGDWAVYFNFYNANGTKIANNSFASNESGTVKDLVLSEDVVYYNYYAYCNSTSLIFNDLELGFMITKDTPEDYVPHEEQTYTIPVQQPFRSIGDVRDVFFKNTVDSPYYDENLVENGWYERHDIGELIIDENTSLNLETGDSFRLASSLTSNIVRPASQAVKPNLMTNYLQVITWGESWAGKTGFISGNSSTNDFRFRVNANMTLEKLRNWLSNHNIKVNYVCIEPTLLPCTPEQIDILENIPSTFAGQTNVFSIDEVEAYLEIQYWESDTNG